MANVTPDKIVISPEFIPPAGAEDIFTTKGERGEPNQVRADDESDTNALGADGFPIITLDGEMVTLDTPAFVIFDQELARAPGGQQVVDVIIQIEDVPGAQDYEVQIVRT